MELLAGSQMANGLLLNRVLPVSSFISFEDVSYKNGKYNVIDDVSFVLEKNTITTLIGPNGAGKSTIAKLLLALKKPSSGKIKRNNKNFAYVPQKLSFNEELPLEASMILDLIAGCNSNHPLFQDIIYFANRDKIKGKSIHDLSGGELQRLIIASAILKDAELLVLDEPTKYLDIDGQDEFYSILDKLRNLKRCTIFLISHDLFTVMKKSDNVLCLNHHLCCKGKPTHTVVMGSKNIGIYSHHHDHKHR